MRKFIGLDNKEIKINLNPSLHPMRNALACKSKIQYACGQLLKESFPSSNILEELPIPKHGLILDFFLPDENLAFEINGRQHDEYTPFFHKNRKVFGEAQQRDNDKQLWCDKNNITLVIVYSAEELSELL